MRRADSSVCRSQSRTGVVGNAGRFIVSEFIAASRRLQLPSEESPHKTTLPRRHEHEKRGQNDNEAGGWAGVLGRLWSLRLVTVERREISTNHVAMVSHPDDVLQLIKMAVDAVRAAT
jgi:hypothetical protein